MPLLEQMAAALDAAHSCGIIHRDFKLSNIMLVPSDKGDRAVITDFGLARTFTASGDSATTTSKLVGTFEYMAPELFAGRRASVPSDVYALGVVSRHMLGESASPLIARAIAKALDPNPAARPLSAGAFVRSLKGDRSQWHSVAFWHHTATKPITRIIAALAFLCVALSFLFFRYTSQGAASPPGSLAYLMDLTNATQDPELDAAGDLLRTLLRQSAHVRLLDDAAVTRARSLVANESRTAENASSAREIALRAGAALVIFSTLARAADTYSLLVEIQKVGATPVAARNQWQRTWQARGKAQVFSAVHDAADWIRSNAGEAEADVADRSAAPEEATSSSWEALSLYRQAETLKGRHEIDPAIALLRRALSIDPDFALAHIRLADYLNGLRRQEEGYQHYQLALAASSKRRLTKWEELDLRGMYGLDTGDFLTAESAYTELCALYPLDPIPLHHLAAAVRYQGRLERAAQLENDLLDRIPDSTVVLISLFQDYLRLGRVDDADSIARKMPDKAMAAEYLGVAECQRENFLKAETLFAKGALDATPFRRSRAASLLGALNAERCAYSHSIELYENGLTADLASGLIEQAAQKHLALASLFFRKGDAPSARIHALEAVRRLRSLTVYRRAGWILARAGYSADAQALLDDIAQWPGRLAEAARDVIQCELQLHAGNFSSALRNLDNADRIDSPLQLREYMAHAYARAGDLERALFVYLSLTKSMGPYWLYGDAELPALRSSLLLEQAALALRLNRRSVGRAALAKYFELRPAADQGLPETVLATKLAAALSFARLDLPERTIK